MSFVDELNSMSPKADIEKEKARKEYENTLEEFHRKIKLACKDNRERKRITIYFSECVDSEYGRTGYGVWDSIEKEAPGLDSLKPKYDPNPQKGTKYPACWITANGEYQPISNNSDICSQYIGDLEKLLKNDGFKDISLDVVPIYESYHVLKYRGLFNPEPYTEKQKTNNVIGYTIKVELHW